jgi:hypothetical protein
MTHPATAITVGPASTTAADPRRIPQVFAGVSCTISALSAPFAAQTGVRRPVADFHGSDTAPSGVAAELSSLQS